MKNILDIDSVSVYNNLTGFETHHPLVSFLDFSKQDSYGNTELDAMRFGVYAVYFKKGEQCELKYGRKHYDYQEGTLLFIAPGQVVSVQHNEPVYKRQGYALLFHPDLLNGTSLSQKFKEYSFFSYDVHEALHLSPRERGMVLDIFSKIDYELQQPIDKHSRNLIASNIELFLNYCIRFYDRQFITREDVNQGVLERFENLLNSYFQSEQVTEQGTPSVSFCAEQLNLSSNYFGDLVKRETGKTAQEYIQMKVIEVAKERIFNPNKSISQIAYELGFKYPQHFTRFFKQRVGCSPNEYRNLN